MERKVRILRFWFAALAVSLLGIWEPVLWFGVVPLFFFPGCLCCGTCNICDPTFAGDFQLVLSGMANDGCTNCAALNQTYVMSLISATNCVWRYDSSDDLGCAFTEAIRIQMQFANFPGPVYRIDVFITPCRNEYPGPSGDAETFQKSYGATKPDCEAFASESIPFLASTGASCTGGGGVPACDGTAASFLLTAL